MQLSRLERRLAVGVLLLFLVPTILAGGILLILHHRGLLETPAALLTAGLIGFVTMMTYLGLATWAIGRSLARTLEEIQLGTELMAAVNPAHRLMVQTGDEFEALAEEINRLADRASATRAGLEREIAEATLALTLERNTLSGVLAALGEGVLVAAPDGRVTLANQTAQGLLGVPGPPLLGRRLWEFTDRAKLEHFLERGHQEGGAPQRFTLYGADGGLLGTVLTPLSDGDGRTVGFILVLRDVSDPIRLDDERRQRLSADLLGLRGRLAAVRSLSESLLEQPAVGGSARRLLEALHTEALGLSGLVTGMAEPARLGLAQAPGHYERLALGDLVAMTLRRLGPDEEAALAVSAVDDGGGSHNLRAEASTLSGTLALLARAVLARRAPGGGAWFTARRRGRTLTLDIGAGGDAREIDLMSALGAGTPLHVPGAPGIHEVVRQHAGEVWAYTEGGRFGFRLTLPEADAADPAEIGARPRPGFVGAGLVSGSTDERPAVDRPDFYDFSLLEEMERYVGTPDRERPLGELAYVALDTETTGLDPDRDQIVSIAGVVVRGAVVRRGEVFDALVNPRRAIPAVSTRFHGITDVAVGDCPPLDVVLPAFVEFAAGAVLIGHHIWFDLHILRREARALRVDAGLLTHPVLDTVALSQVVHGALADHGLEAVAARLGVIVRGRHSALGDALTAAEIFVRLLPLLEKRGVRTLGQALAAARRARSGPPTAAGGLGDP